MRTETTPLAGVIPPVLTPMTDDVTVDEPAFAALLKRMIDAGADGLFVGGTAGLGPLLTEAPWRRMVEIGQETAGGRVPVLAGVMETSTARAVERVRTLAAMGVKRYVLTPTFYITPRTADQFLRHFGAAAEASDLEMIVYNIPACTGSAIPPEVMLDMARRGWTRTVKDSSGDREVFETLCREGAAVGLGVFQGLKPELAWLAEIGAAGIVPVPANVEPETLVEGWRAATAGDTDRLPALQARIDALWGTLVEGYDFLSGAAYALSRQGMGSGYLPMPLSPCNPERQKAVDARLAAHSS